MNRRSDQRRRIERDHGQELWAVLLDLTYSQGLSQAQIAERLGVPVGTVASWFQREGIQASRLAALKAHEMLLGPTEVVA